MNLQEQRLIEDLFSRLTSVSGEAKDADAARLIRDLVSRFPDAPYYLTQSVLVQQQALDQANARIKELEASSAESRVDERRSSTSFLGGASVPQAGRRAEPSPEAGRPSDGPWAQPQPARSGSFLSSALSTATGVAGGMFIAESIRSLFGGGSSASANETQTALDHAQDRAQDAEDDAAQARKDLASDDAALDDMQDAQDDGWGDDDGGLDV